jgi:large conductance mechanosensitive channel
MKKFVKEFTAFFSKGNALDLAVGIVIGTAFNAIIKSLVADIIMPLIGVLVKADVTNLFIVLRGEANYDDITGTLILSQDAILLTYGKFLQTVFDFFTIALAIFIALRIVMRIQKGLALAKNKISDLNTNSTSSSTE